MITAGPVLRGDQAGAQRRAGQLALAVRPHAGRLHARAAVHWIGHGPLCTPAVGH